MSSSNLNSLYLRLPVLVAHSFRFVCVLMQNFLMSLSTTRSRERFCLPGLLDISGQDRKANVHWNYEESRRLANWKVISLLPHLLFTLGTSLNPAL